MCWKWIERGVKSGPVALRAVASSCAAGSSGAGCPAAATVPAAVVMRGTASSNLPSKASVLNTMASTMPRHSSGAVMAKIRWNGRLNRPSTLCTSIQKR